MGGKMRWEMLHQRGGGGGEGAGEMGGVSGPGKRWGHTCNAIKGGKLLYVFGGYGINNCQTNQVHVFDTDKHTWSEPVVKGAPPSARDSHSCTTVGDNLFVFGGTDGMRPLSDLYILDTSSHTWLSPTVRGEGPDAREGHSAALVGKKLFIFGGCGKSAKTSGEVYYNDLYVLDTETFVWQRVNTSGVPPSARDSHSCSSWRNKIVVIGGEDAHDYYLSDVHILDTDSLVWKELNTSGQLLPPRAGHSTVPFGKNLFVFGGFTDAQNLYDDLHVLDVETGIWTKVLAAGDGPSARFSVAGDNLDPAKGGVLVFVGGCNKQLEALDDMYYLYTELTSEQDERRIEKLSLRKQLKLKCQAQNLYPPVHSKALITVGTTELCQPISVPIYNQPSARNFPLQESQSPQGKRSFQAKVTQNFPHGYAIETIIDGKPLRGILFSNRPSSFRATTDSYRKRPLAEVGGIKSNGDHNGKLKTQDLGEQNKIGLRQTDGVHGDESPLSEHQMTQTDSAAASVLLNQAPSDANQPGKEGLKNPHISFSLNSDDNRTTDMPNSSTRSPEENTTLMLKDHVASPLKLDDRMQTAPEENHPTKSD